MSRQALEAVYTAWSSLRRRRRNGSAPCAAAVIVPQPPDGGGASRVCVVEQLAPAGAPRRDALFGSVGLYPRRLFFRLIDDDVLLLQGRRHEPSDYEMAGRGGGRGG